jgi:hypothetical protein
MYFFKKFTNVPWAWMKSIVKYKIKKLLVANEIGAFCRKFSFSERK